MTFTTRAVANLKSSLKVVAKKRRKRSAKVSMPKTRKVRGKILKVVGKVISDIDPLRRPGMGHNFMLVFLLFHCINPCIKWRGK